MMLRNTHLRRLPLQKINMLRTFFCVFLFACLAGCALNNVSVDDSLKKYFYAEKVSGCFGLFDNGQGNFTIYNLKRYRDSSFTPASTFKIVNSLIGLQTGVISDENMVIRWDSINRWHHDWNKEQ